MGIPKELIELKKNSRPEIKGVKPTRCNNFKYFVINSFELILITLCLCLSII